MILPFKRLMLSTLVAAFAVQANAATDSTALVEPMTEYKLYVIDEVHDLVQDTRAFTQAVENGDVEKAKSLYAPARIHYERIEPVAELFADLDASMDAREDDYEQGVKDPKFSGFHRIEYALWAKNSTQGMDQFAKQLLSDTQELESRLTKLAFPPSNVVDGAAALIEEVAATKISGEEDRYSHTDLWDFQANIDGAKKIVDLLRQPLKANHAQFLAKVDHNFQRVDAILAKYRQGDGFESYEALSTRDRKALQGPITVLAEELSQMRGMFGLN
ncbi:iron uptake system protein EfeO [Vibrio zhugei]|uniref:Iron uptake system protein EfeO n=1 Tax=Vibrio zhugei TaxID=2479546 RepID=A0ABV7CCJ5_9VIBR|nr:iron uptake system protein EfeO [Vibrio zhugei]